MDERGLLYPARLPAFHRLPPPQVLEDRVRWFWIPEWNLGAGVISRQDILPFPALNLVIGPEGVSLSGPATRSSHRNLRGRGWAVGVLLRPAAVPAFTSDPGALRDAEVPYSAPDLHAAVLAAMGSETGEQTGGGANDSHGNENGNENGNDDGGVARRARAAAVVVSWLQTKIPVPAAEARLANRLEDLIRTDPSLTRVDQAADRLGVSVRTLQRLARRHVGLPPLAMIRRYRLQEAADRLRSDPGAVIADVAADLGYADHAHLAAAFRDVLGLPPSGYRRAAAPGTGEAPATEQAEG
ncbi:helix-turn-helix domain-containing protein [Arthrobacter sp. Z1-15]